jgi:hypothetical protein
VYRIVYEGSVYLRVSRDGDDVGPGARIARAVRPGCSDIGGQPPPPAEQVYVFRFGTASPRVALTTREFGGSIVAVSSRCFGFGENHGGYLRCLQTEVRFRGRGYTALRGLGLSPGRALGQGTIRGRPVRLRAIQGIDPRIAVAQADDPQLSLVAHRRCELPPIYSAFRRCLRAPLWLAIRGDTRIRSATIQAPGSLITGVRLRLFLAPDGVADEITSPDDERLTPAGRLTIDRKGRGTTRITIADAVGEGRYAVVAQLPGRRIVVVGVLGLKRA